jgi:predicted nuclease of predicted toxin-antitoxin system
LITISRRLVASLADVFPGSEHVWNLSLHDAEDLVLWFYAREHGFCIVSKDADFPEICMLHGFPPKLLSLRIGNWNTSDIEALIRSNQQQILQLPLNATVGVISLYKLRAR